MREASTRLKIPSTFEEAAGLADRVGRLCTDLPSGDPNAADALQLDLAEALNNIVAHAYGGAPGRPVHAELRATPDGCEVLPTDEGAPMPEGQAFRTGSDFDPSDRATLPEGGFGWPLICAQLDVVDYRGLDGCNLPRPVKRPNPGK